MLCHHQNPSESTLESLKDHCIQWKEAWAPSEREAWSELSKNDEGTKKSPQSRSQHYTERTGMSVLNHPMRSADQGPGIHTIIQY